MSGKRLRNLLVIPANQVLGTTLVVWPGPLDRGNHAVVDYHKLSVEHVIAAEQPA